MSALIHLRSARSTMSAIERRIADFILDNAHLLRDYSSQQLANALHISQSSVVKFSQKLGFKGYPDLKFAIFTAVTRENGSELRSEDASRIEHPISSLGDELWKKKSAAEEETRLINSAETLQTVAGELSKAGRIFLAGLSLDVDSARAFGHRLAMLGKHTECQPDAALLGIALASAEAHDVLFAISEHGHEPIIAPLLRQARENKMRIISLTRNNANPLRAQADLALLVSAHDEQTHLQCLLFQFCLQQLLDVLFVSLYRDSPKASTFYDRIADQVQSTFNL